MNELIKAIELIKAEINDFESNFMCDKDDSHDIGFVAGLHRAKSLVRSLQSTNVAPDWIPCSEKLPSDFEEVIISVCDDHGDTPYNYTTVGWKCEKYWISDNDCVCGDVLAWMPLPAPYKEKNL